jgi:hypothetical protein
LQALFRDALLTAAVSKYLSHVLRLVVKVVVSGIGKSQLISERIQRNDLCRYAFVAQSIHQPKKFLTSDKSGLI